MSTVIHVKPGHEGGIRVLTDEPIGSPISHAVVHVSVPGTVRDHDATYNSLFVENGSVVERTAYKKGDPCEDVDLHLSGQREFIVPANAKSMTLPDGTVYEFKGAK